MGVKKRMSKKRKYGVMGKRGGRFSNNPPTPPTKHFPHRGDWEKKLREWRNRHPGGIAKC